MKKLILFLGLFLFVSVAYAGTLTPPGGPCSNVNMNFCWSTQEGFEGYVIDKQTGYGIYGASVKVYSGGTLYTSTSSSSGGHFLIYNMLGSGNCQYKFVFSKSGYEDAIIDCGGYCNLPKDCVNPYKPSPDGLVNLTPIAPLPSSLSVCVSDCDTGESLYNAAVIIDGSLKSTSSDGCTAPMTVSPGDYHSVMAIVEGYLDFFEGGISVQSGETVVKDICMTPAFIDCGLRIRDSVSTIVFACEPLGSLNSPLRVFNGSGIYGVALVEPSHSKASNVRIMTPSGIKSLRKL